MRACALRVMLTHWRPAGHHNVVYVGDRVKRAQLNGKSSNSTTRS
jgi:hypothetical protein